MQFVYGIYCSIYSGCALGKGYKNNGESFVITPILVVKLKFAGEKLGGESFWRCKIWWRNTPHQLLFLKAPLS